MFGSKKAKLESRIKQLNALRAEYRNELEEAERIHKRRDMGEEELQRIRRRCQVKMDEITEKVRAARSELDSLKD
jgi:predicted  nucleic acid-binding Zn-ribbon protein